MSFTLSFLIQIDQTRSSKRLRHFSMVAFSLLKLAPAKPYSPKDMQQQPVQAIPVQGSVVQQPVPTSPWTTDLFSCFDDMPGCCENMWCAHCQAGYQYEAITNYTGTPKMNIAVCGGALCADLTFTGGLALAALNLYLRFETRKKFNITTGQDLSEICQWCWCTPCSQCQVYRELSNRGYWPGGMVCISQPPPRPLAMGGSEETDPTLGSANQQDDTQEWGEFYPTKPQQ